MRLLVLGMHRSGTSLLVRLLESLGFWAGDEDDFNPPTANDPEGYREHRLGHALDESALEWAGVRWDTAGEVDWEALPDARRADVLGAINSLVTELDSHGDWVFKDPRLCLTLPLWRSRIEPTCVFIHRDPVAVARSLHARDGLPLDVGVALWEAYVRQAVRALDGLECHFVQHTDLITAPADVADRLRGWLQVRGAAATGTPGADLVKPAYVRAARAGDGTEPTLDAHQARLLAAVERATSNLTADSAALLLEAAAPVSAAAQDVLRRWATAGCV